MKTIQPTNNTPTIVHVKELPPLLNPSFNFGFNPIKWGNTPAIRINVDLLVQGDNKATIKIATYNSIYKIEGEGLILEEHLYACCQQAIYAMQLFSKFHAVGRSIPQEIFQCPGKEAFEVDLIHLAKALNSIEGKRPFPPPIR